MKPRIKAILEYHIQQLRNLFLKLVRPTIHIDAYVDHIKHLVSVLRIIAEYQTSDITAKFPQMLDAETEYGMKFISKHKLNKYISEDDISHARSNCIRYGQLLWINIINKMIDNFEHYLEGRRLNVMTNRMVINEDEAWELFNLFKNYLII